MTGGVAGDLDRRVLIHVLTRKDADITQSLLSAEMVPWLAMETPATGPKL